MKILLTNDDGVDALGLRCLENALRAEHDVLLCAPDREQSASSHSLSISRPLRLIERGEKRYACDGTPTDCVLLAIHGLLGGEMPDLILSGINHGQNMGEDITYSGTVAAAIEGSILRVRSIAASLVESEGGSFPKEESFASATRFLVEFIGKLDELKIEPQTFLNINFPDLNGAEYTKREFTRLGSRMFDDLVIERQDPRGQSYYWIGGKPNWEIKDGTDYAAVKNGLVSITPLRLNFDDDITRERLNKGG
ncbi:MAG: 5'/3'-nucleotidase SurE [candidate division Zixibacteria bacterium]|nr:5'/3'-nucleotidase SurE [candidate division Zixibacteria bacterium]